MIKKVRRKRIVIKQKESITVRRDSPGASVCPICRRSFAALDELSGASERRRIGDGKKTLSEVEEPDNQKK